MTDRYTCLILVVVMMLIGSGDAFGNLAQKIEEGDQALALKKYEEAETAFSEALKLDPDNYRVLRSLGEIKMTLGKYEEAEKLFDKILSMKVSNGKQVLVTLEGESEPLEAELVDENVVLKERERNNMRNYLTPIRPDPVPHYRFYFFKDKKMELVPKHRATFKYIGVPRSVRQEVLELQGQVKMKLIEAGGAGSPAEMVSLKGGCFQMGSNKGEADEQPVHEVCVSPFKIDKYEVTQRDFQSRMGTNPSRFKGANLPVESVTWMEADEYCRKSGKRLPTEAEWEFAARGGKDTVYYWGDSFDPKMANFCDRSCVMNVRDQDNSDGYEFTAPVGSYPPNPYGLYDMAGNVSEWVADWMDENYYLESPKNDPRGPQRKGDVLRGGANLKAFRGGSWETAGWELRSANRKGLGLNFRIEGIGFRCAADGN